MEKMRQAGFGLLAKLVIAVTVLGYVDGTAVAGIASQYASALKKIFVNLDAEGVDMKFGGPIAAPLGWAQHGQTVAVHELPPVKSSSPDAVHIFYRLEDGSGYIVVRFTSAGFLALRFNQDFDFVAAAVEPNDQPAAALSGAAAQDALSSELRACEAIASKFTAHP
jgi:hypothetical protein